MAYISNFEYYTNNGANPTDNNWGSYQYVSLLDIVNNFELMYVGNDLLINNVPRYQIMYHAKRAIQELNYDALNQVKVLELDISDTMQLVFPPNYVNYVRISLEQDGVLYPMIENKQQNSAISYLQDNNYDIVFDLAGNVVETTSALEMARLAGDTQRIYQGDGLRNGEPGWCYNGDWYFSRDIGNFSMNPDTANINVTFKEDKASGVFNFSSDLTGRRVVLEYISDGMANGDDTQVFVNKLAEDAVYAFIEHEILSKKLGVPMYEKEAARKKKNARIKVAKIRLSNLKPSRILMVLRNQGKWVK